MLEAIDLTKRYGPVQALDGFSLRVEAGEIVGLVGHNGAGKTTFIEMAASLARPDTGTVTVDGQDPGRVRGRIGIAPQHIALYRSITVREHMELFGGLAGLRRAELASAIDELAVALHLTDFIDRRAGLLSGGQQRRTQAAAALIHRPSVLLLDEPTAGADPETRGALLDVVKQRAGEGAAIIYTTHYLPELVELQATIAVARAGRIIARGTSEDLLSQLPGEVLVTLDDEEIRVTTTDPGATLIDLLKRNDRNVTAVELRKPSLDDLYRSLAVNTMAVNDVS
ncbi:ABC-2 type transport system ATP-binding protein [Actinokineospora alba]|uniref:ABC-2 type transport system ATP-binding protein n=1 Tax=Actinokineospora alba TaxID=504798 RepID=A0A1H0QYW6_9PSEU|nr:ABC transporter ATP-binding protein [Actinokineospora alba]TDP70333.1 ABC-2 type transport system ATP-binding protein [Actinokineospora alba]SDI33923.1 ABC-2 type transport system ATP-binding protein [Actinokineospora alba]SDP22315.1 ABC-2 type transport system ATP-binding protein [Actinokineospora alba]